MSTKGSGRRYPESASYFELTTFDPPQPPDSTSQDAAPAYDPSVTLDQEIDLAYLRSPTSLAKRPSSFESSSSPRSSERTVELAYGTPYLLELGLREELTALVWLAGPLSGLLIQPIVGVYSDICSLKWGRRRPFIVVGSVLVTISIVMIAYSREIAAIVLSIFGDKANTEAHSSLTIAVAVSAFYILDFSINAVQACCRALIVDVAPIWQQEEANAWGGRMIGFGNVVGYFMGYINLPSIFPFLGETQLKVLCVIAITWFIITVAITCVSVREIQFVPSHSQKNNAWWKPLFEILRAMRNLPGPVQSVCNVQFWGWLGWFPFLFYSTTWIGKKVRTGNAHTFNDEEKRAGAFALLLFAIISLITGFVLPYISIRNNGEDSTGSSSGSRHRRQRASSWLRRALASVLSLPAIWAMSWWLFGALMFSTYAAHDTFAATAVIALCGISWGAAQWVPFTLMGEYVAYYSSEEVPVDGERTPQRSHGRSRSRGTSRRGYQTVPDDDEDGDSFDGEDFDDANDADDGDATTIFEAPLPAGTGPVGDGENADESRRHRTPTDGSSSSDGPHVAIDFPGTVVGKKKKHRHHHRRQQRHRRSARREQKLEAGIVLGIHNIYIVLPQFVSTFMSAIVFQIINGNSGGGGTEGGASAGEGGVEVDRNDAVGWVLRLGAVWAILAGFIALKVKEVQKKRGVE
ncbi:hypothetical protein HK102_007812 [Quaeritorhiza haematococci]|nr:hypothetical protein HK102_007812 [Quaeritorhiza haematococci]